MQGHALCYHRVVSITRELSSNRTPLVDSNHIDHYRWLGSTALAALHYPHWLATADDVIVDSVRIQLPSAITIFRGQTCVYLPRWQIENEEFSKSTYDRHRSHVFVKENRHPEATNRVLIYIRVFGATWLSSCLAFRSYIYVQIGSMLENRSCMKADEKIDTWAIWDGDIALSASSSLHTFF